MINDKYMNLVRPAYKESYDLYKKGALKIKPWGSHQPVLIHVLNTITSGTVLEFGMGWNSTAIMHTICQNQDRKLISIDDSVEWINKFLSYKNQNHDMWLVKEKELLEKRYDFFNEKFAIAFIDGKPEYRQKLIELLKGNVDYFVVHDTEEIVKMIPYPKYSYKYDFTGFKHVLHFKQARPTTSVLSDLDVVDENLLTIFK